MPDLFSDHGINAVIAFDFLPLLNQWNEDHRNADQKHHGQRDQRLVVGFLQHKILLSSPGKA